VVTAQPISLQIALLSYVRSLLPIGLTVTDVVYSGSLFTARFYFSWPPSN
jgi:hypothetical protein